MSNSPKYDAITIDTSIFERHGFKFFKGTLYTLKQFRVSHYKFVLSDIVFEEMKKHVRIKIEEALNNAKKGTKILCEMIDSSKGEQCNAKDSITRLGTAQEITSEILNNFIALCGVEIIKSSSLLDVDTLLKLYFDNRPPFMENGKKKNEFPDAIALLSLEEWASSNTMKLLVVSTDNDWEKFIEHSEGLYYESDLGKALNHFQVVSRLLDVTEAVATKLLSMGKEIEECIDKYFINPLENYDITIDAESPYAFNYDFSDINLLEFKLHNISNLPMLNLIEVSSDVYTFECKLEYSVDVDCSFDFTIYDHEDKEDIFVGSVIKNKVFYQQTELIIVVHIVPHNDCIDYNFVSMMLSNAPRTLNFGYIDPSDDDNLNEYDYFE